MAEITNPNEFIKGDTYYLEGPSISTTGEFISLRRLLPNSSNYGFFYGIVFGVKGLEFILKTNYATTKFYDGVQDEQHQVHIYKYEGFNEYEKGMLRGGRRRHRTRRRTTKRKHTRRRR